MANLSVWFNGSYWENCWGFDISQSPDGEKVEEFIPQQFAQNKDKYTDYTVDVSHYEHDNNYEVEESIEVEEFITKYKGWYVVNNSCDYNSFC